MDTNDSDGLKQIDELLASNNQSWLLGAGISLDAGIPLMYDLTNRIFAMAEEDTDDKAKGVLETLKGELPNSCHIEHLLSQLGDYSTIAERSKDKNVTLGSESFELKELADIHSKILKWISETVRWGYVPANTTTLEKIGSNDTPIVDVGAHQEFVSALFNRNQAGISERRRAVKLFTTNYDTLLEDALSLEGLSCWDGFSGGAVAFKNYRYGDEEPDKGYRAHLIKLHGSIDWHLGEDDRVWRVRDGDIYPKKTSRVLIYPQSTKYLATQRDPFAAQFDLFRRALVSNSENVLATCGYSFGDEHINQEIELAMQHPDNKTTILAFSPNLNETLERWRNLHWSNRLYIISNDGLYVGNATPKFSPKDGGSLDWWKFDGVAKVLNSGAEVYIK